MFLVLLAFVTLTNLSVNAVWQASLGGEWIVRNSNNSIEAAATVPGGIYTDLQASGILDDIYYRFNDVYSRWVAYDTWTYSRTFEHNSSFLYDDNVFLVFDGLDTYATVLINDNEVGSSDNMFTRYKFDVKPFLRLGENSISVTFESPVLRALENYNIQAQSYIVPPASIDSVQNGENHVNHIRKMQASFAWDWGPAYPSVGIWKDVYLKSYNTSYIEYVTYNTLETDDSWIVNSRVYFPGNQNGRLVGTLNTIIYTDNNIVIVDTDVDLEENDDGEFVQQVDFQLSKSAIRSWWPNGYGDQVLYNVQQFFLNIDNSEPSSFITALGFRTINLIQDDLNAGRTFYFEVNRVPIFAKGSNWIPANILPEVGQNEDTIRFLLQSAKDVYINTLRVWGGGVYESDYFYTLADQLGILIWQDFPFACAMYPTNADFLDSVRTEVRHQVRRLQYHPSIALWAGNNENEVALADNWYGTSSNFSLYRDDYVRLYVDVIQNEVLLNDDSRTYLTSSPSNGLETIQEDYVSTNPQDNIYGDIHYYNYDDDGWDSNIYPRNRFASEYGFQSLPTWATLITATDLPDEDLQLNSDFLNHRQHHPGGNEQNQQLITDHLLLPSEDTENFFRIYVYYNQLTQAVATKTESEFYRRWRSWETDDGYGQTMGALYWQLNDVWQAPTWSSIDFGNRWKMLHYYAKKFFAPILITGEVSPDRDLTVYGVSDRLDPIYDATFELSVYSWASLDRLLGVSNTVNIEPNYSNRFETISLDQLLIGAGCGDSAEDAVLTCFVYLTLSDPDGVELSNNFVFPAPLYSAFGLRTPALSATVRELDNGDFEITITTDGIALFLWLETEGIEGIFSDNGFIQVTEQKVVTFTPSTPDVTLQQFEASLFATVI